MKKVKKRNKKNELIENGKASEQGFLIQEKEEKIINFHPPETLKELRKDDSQLEQGKKTNQQISNAENIELNKNQKIKAKNKRRKNERKKVANAQIKTETDDSELEKEKLDVIKICMTLEKDGESILNKEPPDPNIDEDIYWSRYWKKHKFVIKDIFGKAARFDRKDYFDCSNTYLGH